jgi:hypothetical protein
MSSWFSQLSAWFSQHSSTSSLLTWLVVFCSVSASVASLFCAWALQH